MPTIRIVGDNTIEFVDSNGDVAAREQYDEGSSQLSFEDGDGNPMPISFGDAEGESLSIDDGTVGGGDMIGVPSSTQSANLSFDSYTVIDSDRPVLLQLDLFLETDGNTSALIDINIDFDGGSTADINQIAFLSPETGAGAGSHEVLSYLIPAGASIELANRNDPNASNQISGDDYYQL